MPRDRPEPPPMDSDSLNRSLDRYLAVGLVFMLALIAGFATYKVREPELRRTAARHQQTADIKIGTQLFADNCASCHGKQAIGGGSAPRLNAKEFLKLTTDGQIHTLVAGGVSGTDMPAWSLDFGGTLSDQQVSQLVAYLRSLEPNAPSDPAWHTGK